MDLVKALVRFASKIRAVMIILKQHGRYMQKVLGSTPIGLQAICDDLQALYAQLQKGAIARANPEQRKLLESIPGIGPWLASVILAEIGNPE